MRRISSLWTERLVTGEVLNVATTTTAMAAAVTVQAAAAVVVVVKRERAVSAEGESLAS